MTASSLTQSTALAVSAPGDFGPEHMRIVRDAFAPTASQAEFEVMWAGAKARRLDPVRKQIHFVKRFDSMRDCEVWSSQVSIDGFRAIAEETGKYDGQDEPEYDYDRSGALAVARVRVYRKDIGRAFVGVARWSEYVQTKRGGEPTHMWKKMGHTMLSKCAEALALRKAFPEPLAGLYTGEEMMQADNDGHTTTTRSREVDARATVIDAEPVPRDATPSPPPVSAEILAARARWRTDGGDSTTESVLVTSPDPNDRAPVYRYWIDSTRTMAGLDELVRVVDADPLPLLRADMVEAIEQRRAEMGKQGGGA